MSDVDDGAGPARADEKARRLLDGMHGRRQADALRPALRERVEPRERQRKVAPALVAHERVKLVDDDGADAPRSVARRARP